MFIKIIPRILLMTLCCFAATTAVSQEGISSSLFANELTRPVFLTHDGLNADWVYILEQRDGSTGRIKILDRTDGTLISTFLSVPGLNTSSEQGLLGLAFDPDYENSGYFFINYTRNNRTYVVRYQRSGSDSRFANPGSAEIVFSIPQPFANHNGGWLGFGPDGYLYIGMGDGGSAGDPGNRAQNLDVLLGKTLRIDVSTQPYSIPESNPFGNEIWHYGLRNPWRYSFDRETNDLWISDVGQNQWEELNFQPASSTGGENWGWRCYEGNQEYNTDGCPDPSTLVFPFWEYQHGGSPFRCSITGGYVYRGTAIPSLDGTYFFAEYCSNQIWSLKYDGNAVSEYTERTSELAPNTGAIQNISSFGEDFYGEIYICDINGEIYKIVPAASPARK